MKFDHTKDIIKNTFETLSYNFFSNDGNISSNIWIASLHNTRFEIEENIKIKILFKTRDELKNIQ